MCDSLYDCEDGQDEASCGFPQCLEDEFSCLKGRCIPRQWACNGKIDCSEGEDEVRIRVVMVVKGLVRLGDC